MHPPKTGEGRREKGKGGEREEGGREGGRISINSKNHMIQEDHMLQDKWKLFFQVSISFQYKMCQEKKTKKKKEKEKKSKQDKVRYVYHIYHMVYIII